METYTFDRRQLRKKEREVWCEGLRSGVYTQTYTEMCSPHDPTSACCLHVANIVVDGNEWETGLPCALPADLEVSAPFAQKAEKLIFKSSCLEAVTLSPVGLNDGKKLTFSQIADLLEFGRLEVD